MPSQTRKHSLCAARGFFAVPPQKGIADDADKYFELLLTWEPGA